MEEAIRDIAVKRPHLPVSTAVRLADNPQVPVPPMTYQTSTGREYVVEELADWAWQVPSVADALQAGKPILAIKEIRWFSDSSLYQANQAWEHMKTKPQHIALNTPEISF